MFAGVLKTGLRSKPKPELKAIFVVNLGGGRVSDGNSNKDTSVL